jgi:hypothetical protein
MTAKDTSYAALILPDATGLDPLPYLLAAKRAVARHDSDGDSAPRCDRTALMIRGDSLCVTVEPQPISDFGPRILFMASAAPDARFSPERAARVLSQTVLVSLKVSNADIVEWFAPDMLFDAEEFIRLRSYVSPRRTSSTLSEPDAPDEAEEEEEDETPKLRQFLPIPPAATGNANLAAMFDGPEYEDTVPEPHSQLTERLLAQCDALRHTESSVLRMSAANWAMTGTVACISPPMGASMTVLGLVRGLEFRRVTQALTLTAFFVLLHQQGLFVELARSLFN